jgi:hypothetical protein
MSVFHKSTNGAQRNEPRRADELITPQKLADMIAAGVRDQLVPMKEEIWAAVKESLADAATSIVPKVAKAAASDSVVQVKFAANKAARLLAESTRKADEIYTGLCELVERGSDNTDRRLTEWESRLDKILDSIQKVQTDVLNSIKSSSVETLTRMIEREVARSDFEGMVREQVAQAVREAIRELNRPNKPPEKP